MRQECLRSIWRRNKKPHPPEEFVGDNIRVVRDFPDVFPEELTGMPPDREVEFVIDLLPRTAPISKWTYMMSVEELKELKKHLTKLQEAG